MSYSETVRYLYSLQKYGIKFGLQNISTLTSALENPQESFASIHVAGTNGKGSTSAIIASLLQASGLKVGLFTSPHLVSFTERMSVNGEEITEREVIALTEKVRGKISDLSSHYPGFLPTFFEVVTAMALLYFKQKKVNIAVIEVGMGGRLDATNLITPEVSVITNVSYDHKEFLGHTLKDIAYEKAGIIKERIPVITSSQAPEVLEVIEAQARERNARVYCYGRDFFGALKNEDTSGIYFDYHGGDSFEIHNVHLPLIGAHQMQNASVAINAATMILRKRMQDTEYMIQDRVIRYHPSCIMHPHISLFQEENIVKLIRDGLATTKWPGRLEITQNDPTILIDGAHNPAAAVVLSRSLFRNFLSRFEKMILVLGIMDDKDIRGIMRPLLPLASEIILTAPDYERAASPAKLSRIAASLGFSDVHTTLTVRKAIETAIEFASEAPRKILIVITGSFYTIGEAKEILGEKAILGSLRELP